VIVNEDLIGGVLVMMSFISAAVSGVVTFVVSQYVFKAAQFTVVIATVVAFWVRISFFL
jgi:hypothetical protein